MIQVKRTTILLYCLPMILAISLINLFPILYTFSISLTSKSLFHLTDYQFVGFQNYAKTLGDFTGDFYYVLGITFVYVLACVALFLVIGLGTALALNNEQVRWRPFWSVALIMPWAMPSVITALIWKFLYNYDFGTFNKLIRLVAGPNAGVPWLTNGATAFIAVVFVNLWLTYPFFTVVILGALQSIPHELTEAAAVDGANVWDRFRLITMPLLQPAILPATILSAITTFQMFVTVYLITQGGPITSATKPGATSFVMIYVYTKIFGDTAGNPKYGQIAALSILLFIIILALTILSLRASDLSSSSKGAQA